MVANGYEIFRKVDGVSKGQLNQVKFLIIKIRFIH